MQIFYTPKLVIFLLCVLFRGVEILKKQTFTDEQD